jgi:hypothetical protein
MFGSGHLISGAGLVTGIFVLAGFAASAALVLLTVLAVRRAGPHGTKRALLGGGLALVGVLFIALLFERVLTRDFGAERRAVEARASELVARAIAPGSALACLDAVSAPVETACEKALFATPESVAAAVAYVEARYSLLVASAALAAHDPGYQTTVERLRRGLEEDRFGVVAQVFSTRGCNAPDCADFAVLRDTGRIIANMKGQAFAAHVAAHELAWNSSGAAPVVASAAAPTPGKLSPASAISAGQAEEIFAPAPGATPPSGETARAASSSGEPGRPRYDYPTADKIPAISIMSPEVDPPGAEAKPAPHKRPASGRAVARDRAPVAASPPAQPPAAVVPQTPQTSGSR